MKNLKNSRGAADVAERYSTSDFVLLFPALRSSRLRVRNVFASLITIKIGNTIFAPRCTTLYERTR